MTDDYPDKDPFTERDPRAAEREARRREREVRRKARSAGARRSLADRVSGAIGGRTTGSTPAIEDPAAAAPPSPAPAEPAGAAPPAAAAPPTETAPAAPASAPASAPPPTPTPPPTPAPAPTVDGETGDWLTGTGEWRAPVEPRTELHGGQTREAEPPHGAERPPAAPAAGAGGGGRRGFPHRGAGTGGPSGPRTVWTRRLVALGLVLVALGAVLLVAKSVLGGGEEPAPVVKGPKKLKTISVTVPEGLTISQMADVAKDADLKGDYEQAVAQAEKKFPLKQYGAKDAPNLEGFLFPATYELEKGAPVTDLVAKQLEAFQMNFDPIDMKDAEKKNLTPYDVLIIASMIEKEVQIDKERELVSAVIYNRLAAGDTLGIDATLRYELDNYDEQLLESELSADTPYNTRINAGLPPTPIANPGLASMEAAAHPADSDVYYFVVKPGTCGEHFFTEDSAEFDQAAAEYTAALQAEGGSPTDCG